MSGLQTQEPSILLVMEDLSSRFLLMVSLSEKLFLMFSIVVPFGFGGLSRLCQSIHVDLVIFGLKDATQ